MMIAPVNAIDLSSVAEPYTNGGLFTNPVIPTEKEVVTITMRATVKGESSRTISVNLTITDSTGLAQHYPMKLVPEKGQATGCMQWKARQNGLYTVRAELDPNKAVIETDETNNSAEILFPVIVPGRRAHFVWYREVSNIRWTTCITSAQDAKLRERLAERGVIPPHWEFGGMSLSYYDKEKAKKDPAIVLQQFEEPFYSKYAQELPEHSRGVGIDENGRYPGTFKEQASVAPMRSLVRAKREHTERFFAVWYGGGVRRELAQYYRQGVDLLLLETYVFRAIPQALTTDDIYQVIRYLLDPLIRTTDMIVPAYGNYCYTSIALDSSERPDYINMGEQVVRFIRRICPEMRDIAWYNGGYGGHGLKRSAEMDRHHEAVLANADRLFFDYYITPCVTLMRESLWLGKKKGDQWELTAALSNIGGMDSKEATVKFLVDGRVVGSKTAPKVPAGPTRLHNRALLKQSVSLNRGLHDFEVRITSAPGATLLDPAMQYQRVVR